MKSDASRASPARAVWFLETKRFTSTWEDLNLTVEELMSLQDVILAGPALFPVVPGTGGLRKMRFAPASRKQGKRGALRVCYAYFERFAAVLLVLVFPKGRKANLTADEKKAFKNLINRAEKEMHEEFGNS